MAELHRLYVRADQRGKGLAARLVAHVEAMAREAGARRMELWSDTRFETAHRLYERLGYTRGGTRPLGDISNSIELSFRPHALRAKCPDPGTIPFRLLTGCRAQNDA